MCRCEFSFLLERLEGKFADIEIQQQEQPVSVEPPPIDLEIVEANHQRLMDGSGKGLLEQYFFKHRGLDRPTLERFKIGWDGRNITIPIFDANGDCINFKLKRDPTLPSGSPGMFQVPGRGKKRLFNEIVLRKKAERVIICEGEWDCMMLDKQGYATVTSTGGALSFDASWVPAFDKAEKIYICYDTDSNEAGQRGAEKTAKFFVEQGRKVHIVRLPSPWHEETKVDVTDFFHKKQNSKKDFSFLLVNATEYTGKGSLTSLYQFVRGKKIIETDYPEQMWLVDGFIPASGMSCLSGSEASYKSWLSHSLALSILRGEDFLGEYETKKGKVLFIDKENTFPFIKKRLLMLGAKAEELEDMFFMQGNFMVNEKDDLAAVCNFINEEKIDLVVIDTLVRVHSLNEDKAGEMSQVFEYLRQFQMRGAAVLVLHHLRKNGSNGKTEIRDLLRGSSDISARVETHFSMQKTAPRKVQVTMAKNRHLEEMPVFFMEFLSEGNHVSFRKTAQLDGEVDKQIGLRTEIIVRLQGARSPMSQTELAQSLGREADDTTIRKTLKTMLQEESPPIQLTRKGNKNMYTVSQLWLMTMTDKKKI